MNISEYETSCNGKIFKSIEFFFQNQQSDKSLLINLIKKGEILAKKVNPTLARDSNFSRSDNVKIKDCIGGVIAEYCWRTWLNQYFESNGLDMIAQDTLFESAKNQIDIEVINEGGRRNTVEVRSSTS